MTTDEIPALVRFAIAAYLALGACLWWHKHKYLTSEAGKRVYEVTSFSLGNGCLMAAALLAFKGREAAPFIPLILGFYAILSVVIGLLGFFVRNTRRGTNVMNWSSVLPLAADIGIFLVAGELEIIPSTTAWRVAGTVGTFFGAVLFVAVWRMLRSKS